MPASAAKNGLAANMRSCSSSDSASLGTGSAIADRFRPLHGGRTWSAASHAARPGLLPVIAHVRDRRLIAASRLRAGPLDHQEPAAPRTVKLRFQQSLHERVPEAQHCAEARPAERRPVSTRRRQSTADVLRRQELQSEQRLCSTGRMQQRVEEGDRQSEYAAKVNKAPHMTSMSMCMRGPVTLIMSGIADMITPARSPARRAATRSNVISPL